MPEGPSIVILKELMQPFENKKVIEVNGNATKISLQRIENQTVREFKTWGKHLLICFDDFTIRIHLLLFGSYLINDRKDIAPRLRLIFENGEVNFYNCSVSEINYSLDSVYDWTADVMNPNWDAQQVESKLKSKGSLMVCDALLDQQIFSGVGNIIKNEVLYRIHVHPESTVSALPEVKLKEMIKEAVIYSFEFLKWKKEYTLKQHWLAHTKIHCHRCNLPIHKKYTGKTNRRSFFCSNCQELYK